MVIGRAPRRRHRVATLLITERAVSKHTGNVLLKLGLPPSDIGHRRVLAVLAHPNNATDRLSQAEVKISDHPERTRGSASTRQ